MVTSRRMTWTQFDKQSFSVCRKTTFKSKVAYNTIQYNAIQYNIIQYNSIYMQNFSLFVIGQNEMLLVPTEKMQLNN